MSTREKILDCAKNLFFTIGYEKTSVQRIIDEVGIAKGTFYHHFKTKEQLLDELTDSLIEVEVNQTIETVLSSDWDAITKFNNMVNRQSEWKVNHFELLYTVLKAYYSENNHFFRELMRQKNIRNYAPIFEKIIEQGIREGTFKTAYPKEMSEMVLRISNVESEEILNIMLNHSMYEAPAKEVTRRYQMLVYAMEKILGAKEGSIKIEVEEIITEFIEFMKQKEA